MEGIHVTRWGQSGPRVVLIHGSAQGSALSGSGHFAAQQRLADDGWQVLVPDRPGHGLSPAPGRPDDAELDGAWVADMLGDGAHLVGHSFGGCVALAAAARRPGAVRSLTLIEPAMMTLAVSDRRVKRFVIRLVTINLLSFSAASRAARMARYLHIPPEIGGGSNPEGLKRMGKALRQLRVAAKTTLERELDAVKAAGVPLLVVSGGWSPGIEGTADAVAARGAGRRLLIRADHHFPQLVSNAFNEELAAFMRQADHAAGRFA
jgi:pimeloyl-ACP methyl ester carboxylesterase